VDAAGSPHPLSLQPSRDIAALNRLPQIPSKVSHLRELG
jgi:hypothetical protein